MTTIVTPAVITALTTALTEFLASKSAREKVLLAALGVLVTGWLGFTQIWAPLQMHRHEMAARIPRLERALAVAQTLPAAVVAADPRDLPALITDAAGAFGLNITRLQPEGAKVQITLEDAAFETVLLWIEALQQANGLRLSDLTLTRRPAPGVVATSLTVER